MRVPLCWPACHAQHPSAVRPPQPLAPPLLKDAVCLTQPRTINPALQRWNMPEEGTDPPICITIVVIPLVPPIFIVLHLTWKSQVLFVSHKKHAHFVIRDPQTSTECAMVKCCGNAALVLNPYCPKFDLCHQFRSIKLLLRDASSTWHGPPGAVTIMLKLPLQS